MYLAAGLSGGVFLLIVVTLSILVVALITRKKRNGKHPASTVHGDANNGRHAQSYVQT